LFFGLINETFNSVCGFSARFQPVLWIRIGFNADPVPDPAFKLKVWILIQGSKAMRIHGDPDLDPDQTLK
jgi:hypothetical protein